MCLWDPTGGTTAERNIEAERVPLFGGRTGAGIRLGVRGLHESHAFTLKVSVFSRTHFEIHCLKVFGDEGVK